ncbi:hypothetical protein MAC_06639 [Metarhizium acridum CQMa 102]|uniref:Uncharacterized protein n=1 Tax=Metarhizium acridum (strain CQMa 102) TaxID=655827 RepID=E9E9U1_METAQ|nr:uncharacterized protein MAC_06639 [Metarhizium acridum CQMa 102]EFY87292.1 hypothetical protein MAC_06639 [Metarhizium acridum CQMa 102]
MASRTVLLNQGPYYHEDAATGPIAAGIFIQVSNGIQTLAISYTLYCEAVDKATMSEFGGIIQWSGCTGCGDATSARADGPASLCDESSEIISDGITSIEQTKICLQNHHVYATRPHPRRLPTIRTRSDRWVPRTADMFFSHVSEVWVVKIQLDELIQHRIHWQGDGCVHLYGNFGARNVVAAQKCARQGESWSDCFQDATWLI